MSPLASVICHVLHTPPHQVTIRRRPSLYVINLLVPSSFLIAIDALSFYLPAESESYAPFKMTLLLGYNVFLLMTLNDLLPASGTPPHQYGPSHFPGKQRQQGTWWEAGSRRTAASPLKEGIDSEERLDLGKKNCREESAQIYL